MRPLHEDIVERLRHKEDALVELFIALRSHILRTYPESSELIYHTHALTTVFTLSEKLSDAYCHIPIYSQHLNLGFNRGTQLRDRNGLLRGTGKLIRHVEGNTASDFLNPQVFELMDEAFSLARANLSQPPKGEGITLSRIKNK